MEKIYHNWRTGKDKEMDIKMDTADRQGRATPLDFIKLHLNILLFSFTTVFSKAASIQLNEQGLRSLWLYIFAFLMLLNCGIYALAWQQVIKRFELSVAYANKSVYLIWGQLWAVAIFGEHLSFMNIVGLVLVFAGVVVVSNE